MSNISILIIEDEVIIAQDIADQIQSLGYDIAGIIHNSEKAIDYLSFNTPDLVLCDIRIKGDKDGIDIAAMNQNHQQVPFIFLTSLSDRSTLDRAKKTLPYGYIVKPFTERDLLSAIEIALYKHAVELEKLSITKEKVDQIASSPLTVKEYEILMDIARGLNNNQLTKTHFISINTVKYHVRHILQKMEVESRAKLLYKIFRVLSGKNV
ncbi:MAG: response regulator transcription factor [Saprospiraceae bacterium]|nr:response regulator transcription factor [Saprospiraceae bacterium]